MCSLTQRLLLLWSMTSWGACWPSTRGSNCQGNRKKTWKTVPQYKSSLSLQVIAGYVNQLTHVETIEINNLRRIIKHHVKHPSSGPFLSCPGRQTSIFRQHSVRLWARNQVLQWRWTWNLGHQGSFLPFRLQNVSDVLLKVKIVYVKQIWHHSRVCGASVSSATHRIRCPSQNGLLSFLWIILKNQELYIHTQSYAHIY